eukprot:877174_1
MMMKNVCAIGVLVLMSSIGSYGQEFEEPYCCRKYTAFPKEASELVDEYADFPEGLIAPVKVMVREFLAASSTANNYTGVRLTHTVGFCGNAIAIPAEGSNPALTCVPLCCACCHDMTIRDDLGLGMFEGDQSTAQVLTGGDLHLCCPADEGECYVQDGAEGKVDVAHPGADVLDALETAVDELIMSIQPLCTCDAVGPVLDDLHTAAVAQLEAIASIVACTAFEASRLFNVEACYYTSVICGDFVRDYRQKVIDFQSSGCIPPNPVTVYCAPRNKCDSNPNAAATE